MLCKAEGMDVHTKRWQDPYMPSLLHIEEDFNYFLTQTRLEGFASCPQNTYDKISREFLATFRFVRTKEKVRKKGKNVPTTFDVKFDEITKICYVLG
jgi:hypothetical protein